MLKVGLTGAVACGKSTVGQMLAARGAHLIQADKIAHELYRPGEPVYYELVRRFGPDIVGVDGGIERAALARAAFGSGRVQELNQIVHPEVIRRQEEWMRQVGERDPRAIAVVEAALIFEAGVGGRFDKLIVVTCRPEQRAPRFAQRQQMEAAEAEAEVARRLAAQWPEERKIAAADYVIDNSGPLAETESRVDAVFAALHKLAQEKPSSP